MNPFESSFASEDILQHPRGGNGQQPYSNQSGAGTSGKGDAPSLSDKPSAPSGKGSKLKNLRGAQHNDGAQKHQQNKDKAAKRNNLSMNLPPERVPGLTPPLFTPGGRRLPPIHLLPGGPIGSPGTPGINSLWTSLLSATSANGAKLPRNESIGNVLAQSQGQFLNMLKKLGLTPNELNLRLGFTPGAINHPGFNFGTSGQITPGLLSLLGLSTSHPGTEPHNFPVQPPIDGMHGPAPLPPAPLHAPATEHLNGHAPMISLPPTVPENYQKEERSAKKEIDDDDSEPDQTNFKRDADSDVEESRPKRARGGGSRKKAPPKVKEESQGLSDEERRKQFLERNRVAASKCRQRKKQLFRKMESELSFYLNGYRELNAQVGQLRDTLMLYRELLMSHKECPALAQQVGGYPQLQNLLAQADSIPELGVAAASNMPLAPTGIPVEVKKPGSEQMPVLPMGDRIAVGGRPPELAMVNSIPPGAQDNYSQVLAAGMNEMASNGLRPVSSSSNIQNSQRDPLYGIRPVASMIEMALHPPPAKTFEL